MRVALSIDLICFDFLTDRNIVFALLVLQSVLQDIDLLSLRNIELKEEGFMGFRVIHQGSELFFEVWTEEVPDQGFLLGELFPLRYWL